MLDVAFSIVKPLALYQHCVEFSDHGPLFYRDAGKNALFQLETKKKTNDASISRLIVT